MHILFAGTQAQAQAILLLISIVRCWGKREGANNMHSSKCERVFDRLTSSTLIRRLFSVYNPIQTQIALVAELRCDFRLRFRECAFQCFVFTHHTMPYVSRDNRAHREKKIICLIPNQNDMRVSCFRSSKIQSTIRVSYFSEFHQYISPTWHSRWTSWSNADLFLISL